ncbi:MAG: GTP diphosphokinase [Gammaproteobacteria bacterium]|nr:GTP diphosphokinase [Gammaproteobacteria bacterium]
MVKVKEGVALLPDGSIDVARWLQQLGNRGYFQNMEHVRSACGLTQVAGHDQVTEAGISCLQQGLAMADVLADLEVGQDTLAAAILFESVHYAELSLDDIEEQLGKQVARLVRGVDRMNAISNIQGLTDKFPQNKQQLDNVRKMLLAMVDDVRVVLIKLAERLCVIRSASLMPENRRKQLAMEIMEIYAPLANRLGIGAIKWEMEDLAFRYLYPDDYKAIAAGLKSKRLERDRYVDWVVNELNFQIASMSITHFAVYGRSKHIHSIYRKMIRKNVSLEEIYDATAVRILVETTEQCYEVLGAVHSLWDQIPSEFDDYISQTKANGYQSLHTAVRGPEGQVFEVQIRTFQMHEQAEMGVAAHWKYKESPGEVQESHERKIEWLREVLAWHREMAVSQGVSDSVESEFLDDRVYVFTPDGDILDLPHGVTSLDFAYQVHSDIGHRCRGAKVNGNIVPLTYLLKTGDKVEILTGKELKPSRDWINPHLGYLKTSRAKAKVLHWFKMEDYEKHKLLGQEMLDKELKALGIRSERVREVLSDFNFKRVDDLRAALGRGDLKLGQVVSRLTPPMDAPDSTMEHMIKLPPKRVTLSSDDLRVEGVDHVLTHMARCCQPVPGDAVIGYVTVGRGVSVHRQDCTNIVHSTEKQKDRFLEVSWGNETSERYAVDILIRAFDRQGLLRDISSLLANEKAYLFALQTQLHKKENMTHITLTVEVAGLSSLSRLLMQLEQVPNVLEARRQV